MKKIILCFAIFLSYPVAASQWVSGSIKKENTKSTPKNVLINSSLGFFVIKDKKQKTWGGIFCGDFVSMAEQKNTLKVIKKPLSRDQVLLKQEAEEISRWIFIASRPEKSQGKDTVVVKNIAQRIVMLSNKDITVLYEYKNSSSLGMSSIPSRARLADNKKNIWSLSQNSILSVDQSVSIEIPRSCKTPLAIPSNQ